MATRTTELLERLFTVLFALGLSAAGWVLVYSIVKGLIQ